MTCIKKKRAVLLLICALSLPVPASAEAFGDMFGVMFRMMLVMMNVMSDAMLGNDNDMGWGSGNSFGLGMTTLPMMAGMSGMNPVSGFGGMPGMSGMNPGSGFGGMPGMPGMSGMYPGSGFGGMPGMSPWSGMSSLPMNSMGANPWSMPFNSSPWGNPSTSPAAGAYPAYANNPYANRGYGGYGGYPPPQVSLLDGRWYGNTGELLEIRGNRFRLQDGQSGINGAIRVENNIVSLYSPQTGTVSQYTFIRNRSELVLQDAAGQVLNYRLQPISGVSHTF